MEENNLLENQLKASPEEIRKFVAEEKWIVDIGGIVKKDNLTGDQKIALENEVLFVLIGLDLLGNLEKNIKEALGIEAVLAEAITDELKEKVFKGIEAFLPTEMEPDQKESEQPIETPDLESLPPVKSTELEIPPEMELVPEGRVIDHTPTVVPIQPKAPIPHIEIPTFQAPTIIQEKPTAPTPTTTAGYVEGKDPYRESIE